MRPFYALFSLLSSNNNIDFNWSGWPDFNWSGWPDYVKFIIDIPVSEINNVSNLKLFTYTIHAEQDSVHKFSFFSETECIQVDRKSVV